MDLHLEPTNYDLAVRLDELLILIRETREAVSIHKKIFKEHQKALKAIEVILEERKNK